MRAAFAGRRSVNKTATVTPANLILNGTFTGNDDTGWSNLYFSGKTVSGNQLVFVSTDAYDPAVYNCTLVAGKYYEVTYTVSGYISGNVNPQLAGSGTDRFGTTRTANGTYTERLLANTSNNAFWIGTIDVPGTFNIDNVSLWGPYNTATVGGS